MLNLLFNTLLTIAPHNTQKRRRRKERTTNGLLRRYSRLGTHPVLNPRENSPRWLRACLRSPEKRQKITPVIQAITPGQRLKVEFMKKNREVAQKQEGKGFLLKTKRILNGTKRLCVVSY